jgi:outer membrane protein
MARRCGNLLRAALLVALATSGSVPAADMLSVYRDALANDPQIGAARAQLDAGRERVPQARAGLLPVIGFSGNTTWNDADADFRSGDEVSRSFNSNGYQVQLSQPLFRWQIWVQYDQAKLQVQQAEAQFANARQDLVLRVAQAYFDVLLAQDSLAVAQAQKTAIAQQLEQAKRNFEVGTATIVDTHEAQARYDLVVAQEIAAQNDLEVRRQALRQIIGRPPEPLLPLKASVQIQPPQPADMQPWVDAAEQSSYPVQVQLAALEIAAREIERNRAGHYPTVDLVATHGLNRAGATTQTLAAAAGGVDTTTTTLGLQLAVPIYQGGAVNSRMREAAALRERAANDLENSRRSAAQAARQAYLGVTSGMAQVRALEQALVSSQSALESNQLGYEVGVRINIDVLNAQQQVSSTRRDLARARYETLLAQLRLRAAVGTLGEEDVAAVNALLGAPPPEAAPAVQPPPAAPRPPAAPSGNGKKPLDKRKGAGSGAPVGGGESAPGLAHAPARAGVGEQALRLAYQLGGVGDPPGRTGGDGVLARLREIEGVRSDEDRSADGARLDQVLAAQR